MKVCGLDGRTYTWKLTGFIPPNNETKPRSDYHLAARQLLKHLYPNDSILEEVFLPGVGLFADFYLPLRKHMVEVHGEQHYKFIAYYHGTTAGYWEQKKHDNDKQRWCELNNIRLTVLPFSENADEWRARILA